MTKAIGLTEFHARVDAGKKPRSTVSALFRLAPDIISSNIATRAVPFVFSDDSVDAYGDTIDAKGWVFDRSGAGTVALYGHDPSVVENIIGRAHNVRVEGNKLLGDIEFATAEENPNAERVFRLVKAGFLNSVSVGFQPTEWALAKDKQRPGGIDFKKQKLLEISIVAIPANENAVAQARAVGLDVDGLAFDEAADDAPVIAEDEVAEDIAGMVREAVDIVKRAGKVLSAANESKIRDAHAQMSGACDTLKSLLDTMEPDADDTAEKTVDPDRSALLRDLELLAVPRH